MSKSSDRVDCSHLERTGYHRHRMRKKGGHQEEDGNRMGLAIVKLESQMLSRYCLTAAEAAL